MLDTRRLGCYLSPNCQMLISCPHQVVSAKDKGPLAYGSACLVATTHFTCVYAFIAVSVTVATCVDSGMPERTYAFGASLLLALPIVRHMMSWMGVVPASKHVMLDVLSKASGGAMPEGIAGIFTGASRCTCPAQQPPAFFDFSLLQMTRWHC